MRIRKIILSVIVLVVCLATTLPAIVGGWRDVGELRGIISYARPSYRTSVEEMMAVGMVEAPIVDIEALLKDVPEYKNFMYICRESALENVPNMPNSRDEYSSYLRFQFSQPAKEHDVVIRWRWSTLRSGIRLLHGEAVKQSGPIAAGGVRMPFAIFDFMLAPKGPRKTQVTFSILLEPGDKMPESVSKSMVNYFTSRTISNMRDMVVHEKYNSVLAAEIEAREKQRMERENSEKEARLKIAKQRADAAALATKRAADEQASLEKAEREKRQRDEDLRQAAVKTETEKKEKEALLRIAEQKAAQERLAREKTKYEKKGSEDELAAAKTAQASDYDLYNPGRYIFRLQKGDVVPEKWMRISPNIKAQFEFFSGNDNYEIIQRFDDYVKVVKVWNGESVTYTNRRYDVKIRAKNNVAVVVQISRR